MVGADWELNPRTFDRSFGMFLSCAGALAPKIARPAARMKIGCIRKLLTSISTRLDRNFHLGLPVPFNFPPGRYPSILSHAVPVACRSVACRSWIRGEECPLERG